MKKTIIGLTVLFAFMITLLHAQDRSPDEYIIQKDDTLWDISHTRLEDPFLWPKLWNVNPQIENPDLIFPGNKIVVPSREELLRMFPSPGEETAAPPAKKQTLKKKPAKADFIFAPERKQKYIIDKVLYIASGWIGDTYPSVGEVLAGDNRQEMFGEGESVYLKFNDDTAQEKRYYVIRDIKVVRHPVTRESVGHQIRIIGTLEVTGQDNNIPKATVISAFEEVHQGDGLLPYHDMEPPTIPSSPRTPDIQGYIIESHMNSHLLAEGDVIFLDKGEDDGVAVGDLFAVLSAPPSERPLAVIQVVSLQPSTSGAVLLQSSGELTLGAKWAKK
ncbi:MAG: LysM peptidoglycan-binding domain-containing protein [Nitrospiraceae bacterium]|nr:MAG: LysM peptidoglycan-binding domain-containing protein [Nitrospiraceae bacterium]